LYNKSAIYKVSIKSIKGHKKYMYSSFRAFGKTDLKMRRRNKTYTKISHRAKVNLGP
jgi:hypothetical protein